MHVWSRGFVGLLSMVVAATVVADPPPTLVHNATIYTANPQQASAEALAYTPAGKIIRVGDFDELAARYPDARRVDAAGATIVPGLIDAHGHVLGLGQALMRVDLVGTTSKADAVKRMQTFAEGLPEGQWLLGRGWDQNDWAVQEFPSAQDIDQAFPDRPVWLRRIDGHAGWANSAALREVDKDLAGVWQPEGGEIIRNQAGKATGVLVDRAMDLVEAQVPPPSSEQQREALKRAMDKAVSVGLTGVHDAGTSLADWRLMQSMRRQGALKHRIYGMADGVNPMLEQLCADGVQIDPQAWLTIRAVKLYADGALGSRGAALLTDYHDQPGQQGLLLQPAANLKRHVREAVDCNLQVNIHAIGDRGNRVVLEALQAAPSSSNPGRHRVEHAQVIALSDIPKFKQLGLIASMQPTHATSDMYWAEARVGPQRIAGAYAWQKLLDLGVPLALGSDFPVEKPDPLIGFYAAITRQDDKNWPSDGWYPDQRLTREQALHGFTLGAAYAAFQEAQLGSLEVGKRADFVVLSKDIMKAAPAEILTTEVLATYVDGQAVYRAE